MRAVLDTKSLISAFIFPGGTPEFVYRGAIRGQFELVTSPALLAEFGRVLDAKFGWEPVQTEEAVGQVARIATVVRPTRRIAVVQADPDDDRVLEAALAGGADAIASGDRHLLALKQWQGIRVLRAVELLRELKIEPDVV